MSLAELNRRHAKVWGSRHAHEMLDDEGDVADEPESVSEFFSELYGDAPSKPCPRHPSAEEWLCWCTPGVHSVRREFMTQAERKEVFEKTGVPVESRSDMRAAMREKGIRHAEKGEHCHEMFDALKECGEGKKLDPRYDIGSLDLWGDKARRKPFDAKKRFAEHCERLGISPT